MNTNPDPALYRELSAPFPSLDEANEVLKVFAEDLRALRLKHRLADVVCLIMVNVTDPEYPGEEVEVGATVPLGNELKHPYMLAQQLGKLRQRQELDLARALKKGEY